MVSSAGKRLMAHILDGVANFAVFGLIGILMRFPGIMMLKGIIEKDGPDLSDAVNGGIYLVYVLVLLLSMAIIQLYFWNKSTSMGKMILGMKVIDKDMGTPAGLPVMVLRELIGKQVSAAFGSLGFAWILIDKDNQTWHDKICNTLVVDR